MQRKSFSGEFVGILLAAGLGSRFDPSGARNKLLQPLRQATVVASSARNLMSGVGKVLAVVRPDAAGVLNELRPIVTEVSECPAADDGMAASIVHALSLSSAAKGWVLALGDMPDISPATVRLLVDAVEGGADIAVPTYLGKRGNPVAFSRRYFPELLQLKGDQGARNLLTSLPVCEIPVDDAAIHRDIDTVADLACHYSANRVTGIST